VEHWQAKILGNYTNNNQSFGHDQKIGRVWFGSNSNTLLAKFHRQPKFWQPTKQEQRVCLVRALPNWLAYFLIKECSSHI
jgi:hypothetical protein